MTTLAELDRIAINVNSRRLLGQLLEENPRLAEIMHGARNETEALVGIREFIDLNLRGELAVSSPIKLIWLAVSKGTGGAKRDFFEDMLHLFRQFSGREKREVPTREQVEQWMARYPSGLDPRIVRLREENRDRILDLIIDGMDRGEMGSGRYAFAPGLSGDEKLLGGRFV